MRAKRQMSAVHSQLLFLIHAVVSYVTLPWPEHLHAVNQ